MWIRIVVFLFTLITVYTEENKSDQNINHGNLKKININGIPYFSKEKMPRLIVKSTRTSSSLDLKCASKGNPEPTISWLKNGLSLSRNSSNLVHGNWSLFINKLKTDDSANYTCIACNVIGCVNHTFDVRVIDGVLHKPVLIEAPKNKTLVVGESNIFRCKFSSEIQPRIMWFIDVDFNDPRELLDNEDGDENRIDPQIYELHNVTHDDEGMYTCAADNDAGITYAQAYLKIVDAKI